MYRKKVSVVWLVVTLIVCLAFAMGDVFLYISWQQENGATSRFENQMMIESLHLSSDLSLKKEYFTLSNGYYIFFGGTPAQIKAIQSVIRRQKDSAVVVPFTPAVQQFMITNNRPILQIAAQSSFSSYMDQPNQAEVALSKEHQSTTFSQLSTAQKGRLATDNQLLSAAMQAIVQRGDLVPVVQQLNRINDATTAATLQQIANALRLRLFAIFSTPVNMPPMIIKVQHGVEVAHYAPDTTNSFSWILAFPFQHH